MLKGCVTVMPDIPKGQKGDDTIHASHVVVAKGQSSGLQFQFGWLLEPRGRTRDSTLAPPKKQYRTNPAQSQENSTASRSMTGLRFATCGTRSINLQNPRFDIPKPL